MTAEEFSPADFGRALGEAASAVFAEMTFMDAEVVSGPAGSGDSGDRGDGADLVRAAVDILKPLSCRLEIAYSRSLLDRIGDTLYGSAEVTFNGEGTKNAADRARDDSALEILNVVAGSFLREQFGAGSAYKLGLPFFIFGEAEESGPELARVDLDVEGEVSSLTLRSIRYRY